MHNLLTPSMLIQAARMATASLEWLEEIERAKVWHRLQREWDPAWMVRAPHSAFSPAKTMKVSVSTRYPKGQFGPALTA